MRRLLCCVLTIATAVLATVPRAQQRSGRVEKENMELVGFDDLQARSAYQPLIRQQGGRWIAYVGHHGGASLNPLTNRQEPNGTSILDVTNPKQPRYLAHIPGEAGQGEAGGVSADRPDGSATERRRPHGVSDPSCRDSGVRQARH